MIFECIQVGDIETNCYIFGDSETREVMVVDPGDDGEKILAHIKKQGYILRYVVLTHGHHDHILGMNSLLLDGVKLTYHKEDEYKIKNPGGRYIEHFSPGYSFRPADFYLEEGNTFPLGNLTVGVIHTPGHTKGSCCIVCENTMFSGDTVFYHEIGRCDLEGGDYDVMLKSLKKLKAIDRDYDIYPGHGPRTTLSDEKVHNHYMNLV